MADAMGPGGGNLYFNFVLQADDPKAKQLLAIFNDTSKAVQQTTKQVDEFVKTTKSLSLITIGRDFSRIGSELGVAGGLLTAGFISAANTYVERYKGLEATANSYSAAQQKAANATADLGRVAANALIPQLEGVAKLEEQVARFATEHPELVQAALVGGGAIAAAGGALVAVGQVTSTVARLGQLMKGGGFVGDIAQTAGLAIGAVALFAATAAATTFAINKFGEATGNSSLATFQLGDALTTFRQIVAMGAIGLFNLVAAIDAVVILFQRNLANSISDLGAGIKIAMSYIHDGIATVINGLIDMVSGALRMLPAGLGNNAADTLQKGKLGLDGTNYRQGVIDDNNKAKDKTNADAAIQASALQAGLGVVLQSVATWGAKFAKDGTIGLEGGGGGGGGVQKPIDKYSPEALNAEIAYHKQSIEADRVFYQQKADNEKAYQYQLMIGEQQFNRSLADTKFGQIRSRNEIELKSARDFAHSESEIVRKAAHERLVQQQEFNHSQLELAAEGDVAAYISAQKNRVFQLGQEDRQIAYDKSERLRIHTYDLQIQRIDEKQAQADQLADAKRSHAEQLADQEKANKHAIELAKIQYDRQRTQAGIAFLAQLADLNDNNSELHKLRLAANAQAVTDMDKFYADQFAGLKGAFIKSIGLTPGQAASATTPGSSATDASASKMWNSMFNAPQAMKNAGYAPGGSKSQTNASQMYSHGSSGHVVHVGGVNIGAGNNVSVGDVHLAMSSIAGEIAKALAESGGQ